MNIKVTMNQVSQEQGTVRYKKEHVQYTEEKWSKDEFSVWSYSFLYHSSVLHILNGQ